MDTFLHIPLARGEDQLIQIILGAVFAAIWVIGALLNAMRKKPASRRQQDEKSWQEILRDLAGEKPSPPPAPSPPPIEQRRQNRPQPVPQPIQSRPQRPGKIKKQPKRKPAPPPVPVIQRPLAQPAMDAATEILTAGEIGSEKKPTAISPASALSRLLTPENLHRQYILTEIFQPPLALRDNRPG
jgi:hypothetical protein